MFFSRVKGAGRPRGGRLSRQEFVLFFFSYVFVVLWIFFQVTVAVLLENFLSARCHPSLVGPDSRPRPIRRPWFAAWPYGRNGPGCSINLLSRVVVYSALFRSHMGS